MTNCFTNLKDDYRKKQKFTLRVAVPLTTRLSSLARRFSRYGAAMSYTDLLGIVAAFFDLCDKDLT